MTVFEFEASINNSFSINGGYEVYSDPASPPTSIVKVNEAWGVRVNWNTVGPLNNLINGNFRIQVLFDKLGIGEAAWEPVVPPVPTVPTPAPYTIQIACGPNLPAGMYKLAVYLFLEDVNGNPAGVICCAEGPTITVYN
ncbi:MAG TPA: hypothetical protein PL181_12540 [bacterium]|nr:hypothetical protein [bacterium]